MFCNFGIAEIKILRESIGDIILLPWEPLRIFFDVVVDEMAGVFPCNFKVDGRFVGVHSCFKKNVFFSQLIEVVLSVINKA